jgi:hypothetical protein
MEYIIIEDGKLVRDMDSIFLWYGEFSIANKNCEIIQYLKDCLPKNSVCMIPKSDGNLRNNPDKTKEWSDFHWNIIEQFKKYAEHKNKVFILGTLCQIYEEPGINYLYLPLDDELFENGVNYYFSEEQLPRWEDKSEILCWRGSCSGLGREKSLRVSFVQKIKEYASKNNMMNDVKLSYQWSENMEIPDELFGERYEYNKFLNHKIFFIIDGNCISSNYMWGFASMSVPVMITNAKCWFSQYLIPFVHFVPVKHDLSDLIEQLDWIKNNDDIAKNIAQNAREFSHIFFSSDFQKNYVKNQVDKFCNMAQK